MVYAGVLQPLIPCKFDDKEASKTRHGEERTADARNRQILNLDGRVFQLESQWKIFEITPPAKLFI